MMFISFTWNRIASLGLIFFIISLNTPAWACVDGGQSDASPPNPHAVEHRQAESAPNLPMPDQTDASESPASSETAAMGSKSPDHSAFESETSITPHAKDEPFSIEESSEEAPQVLAFHPDQRLTVTIAQDTFTRLSVDQDRIISLFGEAHRFTHQLDERTGHVFIKPTTTHAGLPFALSLSTEQGHVQDFWVIPVAHRPAPIRLIGATSSKASVSTPPITTDFTDITRALQQVRTGKVPILKYAKIKPRSAPTGLNLRYQAQYRFGPWMIQHWRIKNLMRGAQQTLSYADLYQSGDWALSLQEAHVKRFGTTSLYVVRRVA